jgi:hypothetical protein
MTEVDSSSCANVDARFVNLMNHVAKKFGCTVEINWETHTINFEGPENMKTQLALELDKYVQEV